MRAIAGVTIIDRRDAPASPGAVEMTDAAPAGTAVLGGDHEWRTQFRIGAAVSAGIPSG